MVVGGGCGQLGEVRGHSQVGELGGRYLTQKFLRLCVGERHGSICQAIVSSSETWLVATGVVAVLE